MSNDFSNDDYNAMLQAMEKEEKESRGNLLYWNPKNEGTYPIRFISPLKSFNEVVFYQRHKIHYINKKPYFCLNQTLTDKNGVVHEAEECPICKKKNALYALSTGKESEEAKLASSISAKDRYVSRVVVRGLKDEKGNDIEAVPQFYEFGSKIHTYLFGQMKLGECGNFLSLKDGRDFLLSKTGTGKNTDYSGSSLSMKQTPVFTDAAKVQTLSDSLKKMDYSQLVEFKSPEELKELLGDYFNETVKSEETVEAATDAVSSFEDQVFGVKEVKSEAPKTETLPDDIDDILSKI
jgi:hypothetical protein